MENIKDFLKNNRIITDGAFGTYYSEIYRSDVLPETDNINNPENVARIHRDYLDAGAMLLRTNTYASNSFLLKCSDNEVSENIRAAAAIAKNVVKEYRKENERPIFIMGDIGPVAYDHGALNLEKRVKDEYISISKTIMECGLDGVCFETLSQLEDILPAIEYIKSNSDLFVIVQFSVNQFGYSDVGLSARNLLDTAAKCEFIDAVGLNCGVGPGHMYKLLTEIDLSNGKFISALPNAGYPQSVSNRLIFASDNSSYFKDKLVDISRLGVSILGGCCGTTPEYIGKLKSALKDEEYVFAKAKNDWKEEQKNITDNAFYSGKKGKKLIAVELAPPIDCDDNKLLEAAHILIKSNVDVLTFPDSPSGRTRADSVLMAEKVAKQTGLKVMPHLCCRDKNAIAMRSQLLGAHINDINNFLVITGDPIPSVVRQSVKAVFNFDSVGLMNIIKDMNNEQFAAAPTVYGGAINQNRLNLDFEIKRVLKKMEAGATFFMSQPVFDTEGISKLKRIKDETGCRLLCGIMPFVSLKNALFMKNEMTGISVPDSIIERYSDCVTKDDGETVGVSIAKEMIEASSDFVDGYYFSFPFNRVYLLERILK